MRTIGVLGGIGPQATIDFERRLHTVSQAIIPQDLNRGYPPLVTVYLRHPPVLTDEHGSKTQPLALDPRLLETVTRLGSWADLITIPCNTPHRFLDEIRAAAGCEVLSLIDVATDELRRREATLTGLLGWGVPDVYSRRFAEESIDFVTAAPDERERLDDAILRLIEGSTTELHRQAARGAVATLRSAGADAIVLGCTEIPLLLGKDAEAPDLINPAALLAEAAVRRAIA